MKQTVLIIVVFGAQLIAAQQVIAQSTTIISENFDSAVSPDFGAGVSFFDSSWKTSTSSASPGSGGNNAVHTGSGAGVLVLGPIDLSSVDEGTFSYYARRTSSYSADSLIVLASIDGGTTFPITLFAGGLPGATSTYELISVSLPAAVLGQGTVHIEFDARGGTSSGSNIRIDDVLIEAPLDLSTTPAAFGFEDAAATWNLVDQNFQVGIDLSWPGPDSIQGFQFDLDWDDSIISLDSIFSDETRLPPAHWSIAASIGSGTAPFAALSLTLDGLPPGAYGDLLTAHFSLAGPQPSSDSLVTLGMTSLLVTATSPLGTELSLPLGNRSLALTLSPNQASISLSQTAIDFGSVVVGDSASVVVTLSNASGSASLDISSIDNTDETSYAALPASLAVGASTSLVFWFKPSFDEYGLLSGNLVLYHNAPGDSTVIAYTGVGLGGRGDSDADGAFDVADVVGSLDVTVNPALISAADLPRHDLHPFPEGNGLVDIRDVTVGIQAILRDEWPDGRALPVAAPVSGPAEKWNPVQLFAGTDGVLSLISNIDLRGIQLEFTSDESLHFKMTSKGGVTVSERFDERVSKHRALILTSVSAPLESGTHELIGNFPLSASLVRGVAIDLRGSKVPVSFERAIASSTETPLPREATITVYPNPILAGSSAGVSIALQSGDQEIHVSVYDALGRAIFTKAYPAGTNCAALPGEAFRAPGLYFIRIVTQKMATTIPIIAAR